MTKRIKLDSADSLYYGCESTDYSLRLNSSNNACFFCQKPVENAEDFKSSDVCLSSILRLINLGVEKGNKNVSVCDKCGGIAKQLSTQIELLEVTKMKVNYGIQQLHNILQQSKPAIEPSSAVGNEPVEFRSQFTEKCTTKVETINEKQLPVVSLQRLKSTIPQQEFPVVRLERLKLKPVVVTKPLKSDELVSILKDDTKREFPEPRSPIHDILKQLFELHYKPQSKGKKFLCLLCEPSESFSAAYKRHHMVQLHADKIFQHQDSTNNSDTNFAVHCNQVLDLAIDKSHPKSKLGNCEYCNQSFVSRINAQYHLITQHFEELVKRMAGESPKPSRKSVTFDLPNQQKIDKNEPPVQSVESVKCANPEVESIFQNIENHQFCKTGDDELQCLTCNAVLPFSRLRAHVVRHHPEKLFARQWNKEYVSQEEFKVYCVYAMNFKTQEATRSLNKEHIRDNISCPNCDTKVSSCRLLRYHLVTNHFKEMEGKIDKLQLEGIPDTTL